MQKPQDQGSCDSDFLSSIWGTSSIEAPQKGQKWRSWGRGPYPCGYRRINRALSSRRHRMHAPPRTAMSDPRRMAEIPNATATTVNPFGSGTIAKLPIQSVNPTSVRVLPFLRRRLILWRVVIDALPTAFEGVESQSGRFVTIVRRYALCGIGQFAPGNIRIRNISSPASSASCPRSETVHPVRCRKKGRNESRAAGDPRMTWIG